MDPAAVGSKASSLSRARRAGLPVLPGFVVPVDASADATAAGARGLAARSSGYARMAIIRSSVDAEFAEGLEDLGATLGDRLVVRSSAITEDRPTLSGAFASYAEIAPAEVAKAVQGCWASVFTEDALGRLEAEEISPEQVGMAVLVQRELQPAFGGVATVAHDGSVEVIGVKRSPAAVVSGWEPGEVARVSPSGIIEGDEAQKLLGAALVTEIADLAVLTFRLVGKNLIEWAMDGELWMLQTGSTERTEPPVVVPALKVDSDPRLESITRTVARHAGSLADSFVLSWAIGVDDMSSPAVVVTNVAAAFEEIEGLVERLERQRWSGEPSVGAQVRSDLRAGKTGQALARIEEAPEILMRDGRRVMALLGGVANRLTIDGRIPRRAVFFHLEEQEARSLATGQLERIPASRRIGRGRWEPFLFASISVVGEVTHGRPVVAGPGAGRLRFVHTADDAMNVEPRDVIVARQPINNLAPLLWEASAIVTIGGGPGAHLFEVASSLSVPTVCAANIELALGRGVESLASQPALAAVDGTTGTISILDGDFP